MGCFSLKKREKNGASDLVTASLGHPDDHDRDPDLDRGDGDGDGDGDGNGNDDGARAGSGLDSSSFQQDSLFQTKVRAIRNAQKLVNHSSNSGTLLNHLSHGYGNVNSSKVLHSNRTVREGVSMPEYNNNNAQVHDKKALPLPSPSPSPSPSLSPSPSPSPPPSGYALPHPMEVITHGIPQDFHQEQCKRICVDLENFKKTSVDQDTCIDSEHCNKKTCIESDNYNKKTFVDSEHCSKKACVDSEHNNKKTFADLMVAGQDPYVIGRAFPIDRRPLPHPKEISDVVQGLKSFSMESISLARQQFLPHNFVGDDNNSFYGVVKVGIGGNKRQEVVISQFTQSLQLDLKEWISELCTISSRQDSHVCNLIGFHAEHGKTEHFLVYEKLQRGSLHTLMFESPDSPPLDWATRMRIAYGAAQGLASLHDKHPKQIPYKDFRLSHIQVDADYSSKVVGYYFTNTGDPYGSKNTREFAYCAPEVIGSGGITLKGNVWSFGVVLLELLTGRKNMDERIGKDERDLVKWSKPFLTEKDRLFLVMDSKLKGQFPSKGAKIVADLVLRCLHPDPSRRPTMKIVVEMIKSSLGLRNPTCLPPEGTTDSINPSGGIESRHLHHSSTNYYMENTSFFKVPTKFDIIGSPPLKHLVIPPRSCALEGSSYQYHQDYVSAPLERLRGI